jgi:DNA-binding CsgD family transcriptional regulator
MPVIGSMPGSSFSATRIRTRGMRRLSGATARARIGEAGTTTGCRRLRRRLSAFAHWHRRAVTHSVVVRLGRLGRAAAVLAAGVAVLGGEGELRHAAALANLELNAAMAAADSLAAAGLLEAGRPLRLIHPVVRTALYAELRAGERARLHRQAAAVLAEDNADPSAICAHLLASEPAGDPWTSQMLERAAERALARGAPRTAVDYLRRALAEPPPAAERPAVLGRLAFAETGIGDPAAGEHLDQAIRLVANRRQRAELASEQSIAYLASGRFDERLRVLEQAIEDCPEGDEELRWRLEAHLVTNAGFIPAHAEIAARHLQRIPRDLPGDSPGARAALAALAVAHARAAEPAEEVLGLARRADVVGRLLAEQPPGSVLLQDAIWTLALADQHTTAERAFDQLIDQARRAGSPSIFALMSYRRSMVHRLSGSLPDAIADAQAAVDAGTAFGASLAGPAVYSALAMFLIDVGDLAGAQRAVNSIKVGEQIAAEVFWPLLASRGCLQLAQGNLPAGVEDLLATQAVLARTGIANPAAMHFRSTAALALARLGREEQARALAAEELAVARRFGAAGTVGTALRTVGALERSSSGIEMLREALDLADRCGAKPVAERAREELLISGARPRRARLSGAEALTASERRVAELAAGGLSNREIAQALFVSLPTVTTHLTHCYQKLAISSRAELPGALGSRRVR